MSKPRIGWYYHLEWANMSEPEYWNGEDTSPLMEGPFKSQLEAYEDQRSKHRHDVMESQQAANWCSEQMKALRKKK